MSEREAGGPDLAALAAGPVTPDLVRQLLRDVIDPELGSTSSTSAWSTRCWPNPDGSWCG